jgi:hypothetical protein
MGYRGICQIHGEYHDVVLCPLCIQDMFKLMASTTHTSAVKEPHVFNLLQPPFVPSILQELQPISLGRWEEQTDTDREFLQACGISQE